MARLYDRIAQHGFKVPEPRNQKGDIYSTLDYSYQDLQEAKVFNIQNVAKYYFIDSGKEWGSWDFADFPSITPPFDKTFFEFKPSPALGLGPQLAKGLGAFFKTFDNRHHPDFVMPITPDGDPIDPELVRWWVRMLVFMEFDKGIIAPAMYDLYLTPEGTVSDDYGERAYQGTALALPPEDLSVDTALAATAHQVLYPAFLALSLLNCRNVTTDEHEPPPKASRKSEKRYGHPLTKFYTLQIEAPTPKKKGGDETEPGIPQRSLHICRGNFATYTKEKPLFGKYAGTFWRPQHMKGSRAAGEVVKDYNINQKGALA